MPAIKIARIGRSIKFRELKLGKLMIDYIIYKILKDFQINIGVRMVTLDAYEDSIGFYLDIGFDVNRNQGKSSSTVSMRLDIFDYAEQL